MQAGKFFVAAAALAASFGASAQLNASAGGGYGTFLALTSGSYGTACGVTMCDIGGYGVTGGTIYNSNNPSFAALPPGTTAPTAFLAAGPTSTEPSSVTFGATGIPYISFLWGSPDYYNMLTVTTTEGVFSYDAYDFFLPSQVDGSQSFSGYVQFQADSGVGITGLTFANMPSINAFEVANFSVTPVPEPETYALILAGLGALGFITRRRRNGQA